MHPGTTGEKASLVMSSNYHKGDGYEGSRNQKLKTIVDYFNKIECVNAAINGELFNANFGLANGKVAGICYVNGTEWFEGDLDKFYSTVLIYDGTKYIMVTINSETKYLEERDKIGSGGWMLSGVDSIPLVKGGKPQSGWATTDSNKRSMMGYTSSHAPVIAATTSGSLTYKQAAEIMAIQRAQAR